ncbi:tRNA preQ1(34) S-adenosylmethionine ribosyltransferase-isomerase QueA [Candidatus Rickettsiella viridis]|uniref:tRNA preQ1(34) S-adenosylmethionine ribosyltransferase-isomerase QueA n=1 Tax=Candidatus Rickettsiella viridis TaxID=676208 RepID=UPI000F848417|nr:tRNA preQ1(34) S-adenosylmethionine ribosyltransferase-isomerase QueA [Candidatus Rickettsiella viridis]
MTSSSSIHYSVADFFYDLPPELIAAYPTQQRTDSRLMCLNKQTKTVEHKKFKDILTLINPGDLLVLNDTKVIPARLFAHKPTGGKVEILIERILDEERILAHLKSSKSLKIGTQLHLENEIRLEITNRTENLFELQLLDKVDSILALLNAIGHMPLPPYLQRQDENFDKERYQTIFAQTPGAVAAPTAGLHFDEELLTQLRNKGVNIAFITLHVGSGTFQPIRTEKLEDHLMHSETVTVSAEVCQKIAETKRQGKRVIAVGTTTVRSLETVASKGFVAPFQGETKLFIYPGFSFHCVDALITNFHLPTSTLLMLVCAFAGYQSVMHAYQQAINHQYRFFSYGDALWVG